MKKINQLLKFVLITFLASLVLVGCASESSDSSSDTESEPTTTEENSEEATSEEAETKDEEADSTSSFDKIVVGTEGTYSPFTYHDDNGDLVGYDVDVARAIAEEMGVEIEFMEVNWEGLLQSIDTGQVDAVFNQVGVTEEREEKYLFTDPYLYSYPVLLVHEDNDDITSFEDAEGLTTSLNVSSNYAGIAEDYGIEIVPSETFNNDIELLVSGRNDVVINDSVAFADLLKERPDIPVKIAATLDEANIVAAPLKADNEELQAAINEALAALQENGKLAEISQEYLGDDFTQAQ